MIDKEKLEKRILRQKNIISEIFRKYKGKEIIDLKEIGDKIGELIKFIQKYL